MSITLKMRSLTATISVLLLFCLFFSHFLPILGDVGTARSYSPPYLPTKCKGNDPQQFPEGGYFVAVSDGLWDNGAACGRRYQLRCISRPNRPCRVGSIVAEVVDLCRRDPCPSTLVLSTKAFDAISRFPKVKINLEYAQI
ncbi:EG45-like domain containing protein [Ziziphus jujuba]|uniref:EG45-like domain containing protein n=1 Tax=Ziziphus jujuba TaxID=326968 RepID=A0ABM3IP15_ZIZJJ|nr:EG45-like domain containing protein [Ziziphus jujuba]